MTSGTTNQHASSVFLHDPEEFSIKHNTILKSGIILKTGLLQTVRWENILPARKNITHFVVTDKTVNDIYGDRFLSSLTQSGFVALKFVIHPGERAKSFETYKQLSQRILTADITKHSYIIGLGGGVVNNLAGFLASTIYRGIGLIQTPTTLLAQIDAAIDFKQAINSNVGKNHIGSYYAASTILVDPRLLQTLPIRQIRNGLAESVKHGFVQGRDLYNYIIEYRGDFTNENFLYTLIRKTIELKVRLLNQPVGTEYAEMIPQYGHAIGHALEQITNYKLHHGEALAIGMCVMAEVAKELKLCDDTAVEDHYRILAHLHLPTQIPKHISTEVLLHTLRHDKHFSGTLQSVLVSNVGQLAKHGKKWTFSIDEPELREAFRRNQNNALCN